MAALSEWLHLMLAEIARKREDLERGLDEESKRRDERPSRPAAPAQVPPSSVAK